MSLEVGVKSLSVASRLPSTIPEAGPETLLALGTVGVRLLLSWPRLACASGRHEPALGRQVPTVPCDVQNPLFGGSCDRRRGLETGRVVTLPPNYWMLKVSSPRYRLQPHDKADGLGSVSFRSYSPFAAQAPDRPRLDLYSLRKGLSLRERLGNRGRCEQLSGQVAPQNHLNEMSRSQLIPVESKGQNCLLASREGMRMLDCSISGYLTKGG